MKNDKLKHFIACVLISWVVILASHLWFPLHYNWDMGLGFIVGIFAAIGKELVWDKWLKRGQPDYYDLFWGVVGSAIGPAIWLSVELILGKAEPLPW